MRKLTIDDDVMYAEIPPKGLLCKVYLPGESQPQYLTPDKLGRILQAIPDADAAEGLLGWHDFLDSHGIASKSTPTRTQIILTFPQMKRTIPYTHTEGCTPVSIDPVYPPCTFYLVWDNGKMTQSFAYTSITRPRSLQDGVPLQRFPWGNADEEGRICWGYMHIDHLNAKDPLGVVNIFFSTVFNQHIWGVVLQDDKGRQIMFDKWVAANPDKLLPFGAGTQQTLAERVTRIGGV